MNFIRRGFVFLFDVLESIVVALAIFVVAYLFITQPHEVVGASMAPNFEDGQYILTDKITYHFSEPQRGDVVVFKSPKSPDVDFIKRIIGLPGDRILISDGNFLVNGQPLDEPYIPQKNFLYGSSFLQENQEFVVPKGEYFVVGDNRPRSSDSREWGTIEKEDIIGRSFLRYWPFDEFGVISRVVYTSNISQQ